MKEYQWYIFSVVFFVLYILFSAFSNLFIPATYIFFLAEWICFAIAFGCWIAGLLEGHAQKKLEEEKMMISYVKEKVGLKGKPKNTEELLDLAKTSNKIAEVLSEMEYWYKKGKKEVEGIALFYPLIIANKIGLKKKPKNPKDLFRLARKEGRFEEAVKLLSYLEKGQVEKFTHYKNKEINKAAKTVIT